MKYSTTLLAAANIVALTQAAPLDPGCSLVIVTYTGPGIWIPNPDPSWLGWTTTTTTTTTKPVKPTTTSVVWPDWTSTTTTTKTPAGIVTDPWNGWYTTTTTTTTKTPAASSKTTSSDPWGVWTTFVSPSPPKTTSTASKDSASTTTAAATTTTAAPVSVATCPASNGATVFAGGDCGCGFQVNCDSHADVTADTKFWEKDSGALVLSLAECLSICDNNSACQAVIWVDDPSVGAQDYHRCWQTSGLGGIIGSGSGQISYKGSCAGSC